MIRFLVIAFCVIMVLRWILKPYLKNMVQSSLEKMAEQQNGHTAPKPKPEGTITVIDKGKTKRPGNRAPGDGDFIDYTEIN
jgi:hypothetical protein